MDVRPPLKHVYKRKGRKGIFRQMGARGLSWYSCQGNVGIFMCFVLGLAILNCMMNNSFFGGEYSSLIWLSYHCNLLCLLTRIHSPVLVCFSCVPLIISLLPCKGTREFSVERRETSLIF